MRPLSKMVVCSKFSVNKQLKTIESIILPESLYSFKVFWRTVLQIWFLWGQQLEGRRERKKNCAGRKKNLFYAILLCPFFFKFCLHLESFAVCSSYLAEYLPFILQAGLFFYCIRKKKKKLNDNILFRLFSLWSSRLSVWCESSRWASSCIHHPTSETHGTF